ncbi:MAG: sigma-54-dependent Fis family transcriptional regulator [Ignavibacteriales bacterium]|nr:sigma-54-dependent Fis family transcriptional regulator [Ignavibacteriales bacterium]MCF8316443.1 sigma-54-dependent Fis family transcriptional regulator [Ignavibacteriales bacterium]MCF8437923.1 sigma-54-dependent Fis family transcriptional regulator [Ignavibacteriales bacterium]
MTQSQTDKVPVSKKIDEIISAFTKDFLELANHTKNDPGLASRVQKVFISILGYFRGLQADFVILEKNHASENRQLKILLEEKRRLETLYTTGIYFLSEMEMKKLLEKALDTVVNELKADEGFIVLTDDQLNFENIVTKNMDDNVHHSAKEMSTSVIKNALQRLKPVKFDDLKTENDFAQQNSVISLGLKSTICVPLISGKVVFGAVYLDRRQKENPFTESDLKYLISFAKQIVKGIEISEEIQTLENELQSDLTVKFKELRNSFFSGDIIGRSRKLYEVLRVSEKVSKTNVNLLILGENGTGKDLLAQAIHLNSPRKSKPFIAINCGAIPADLLESELFGYESGAFTGATKSKPGRLELAEGGTIFLDEIGEMSQNLQAKLLRVIQTHEIERLGSTNTRKIDVRFISATNKNLTEMIENREFREDLYYRLKVIEIKLSPLRERKEDIELLVEYFLEKYSLDDEQHFFTAEAMNVLEEYGWPGNIRELENVVQRCIVLAKAKEIDVDDLPPEIIEVRSEEVAIKSGLTLQEAEHEFRKMYVLKTLRKFSTKSDAAKALGVNRTHFYKLLSQLDIPY